MLASGVASPTRREALMKIVGRFTLVVLMGAMVSAPAVARAPAASNPPTSFTQPANWTQPFPPFQVIDNVYYVGSAGLSAWLIKTPGGLILLDVGVPANAGMVENNIEALGFRVRDIKILLNSHAHFDHSGGLARLKADTGAILMASKGDRYALEKGVYPGSEAIHALDFPPVKVDRVLNDGDKVSLGGVTLTARITPGHTAGCTSYLLPVTEAGVRHTAFFFCSATIAANRLAPDPQYPGIVADYRRTFALVKTIKADVYLAPHAEFYDLARKRAAMAPGKPNPFVDPDELPRAIARFETDFEAGLARQEGAAKP
jgi:metallo-beta-lactamase class B